MTLEPTQQLMLQWIGKKLTDPKVIHRLDKVSARYDVMEELQNMGLLKDDKGLIDDDQKTFNKVAHVIKSNLRNDPNIKITDTTIGKNVTRLAELIGLTADEAEVFVFIIMIRAQPLLFGLLNSYGRLCTPKLIKIIADLLGKKVAAVERVLSSNSVLIASSLIKIIKAPETFDGKIEIMNRFDEFLCDDEKTTDQITSFFINPVKDVKLTLDDYPHIDKDLQYLIPYLKNAVRHRVTGCNVLLYGIPGTGKTELVKTLAKAIHANLYEVKTEHDNHDSIYPSQRLESYQVGLLMFSKMDNGIILFDEIEDILSNGDDMRGSSAIKSKAWFNRMLESNPVPTLWTSNSINTMDKAYLRRFDIVIEMTSPDHHSRNKLLLDSLHPYKVDRNWIAHVSGCLPLAPAEGARIAKVLSMTNSGQHAKSHARQMIQHSYTAATHHPIDLDKSYQAATLPEYHLEWLNTKTDIQSVFQSISKQRKGRVCLYGAPGTGKTQFSHHIAKAANMPIMAVKASDLISPFVGQTEQNIAHVFAKAESGNALLLIDEADSFFSDRHSHQATWETTQVNELLVQMEQFDGLFIASTNLIDNFDPASMRRFDFKIQFEYPTLNQIWDMFCNAVTNPDPAYKEQLASIQPLTPGNFKVAQRQAKLLGIELSSECLLGLLREEAKCNKPSCARTIGFIH